ncbi:MAG: response regulator [Bacteroidales bacterium]|nr:response regulator [Bacteroidales bacterium]
MSLITILVVDDKPEYLRTYATIFFEEGIPYKVISATNGKMAVELAQKENPDIIIMDWQMPVMDGLEALQKLKGISSTCDIPVIMASGIMLSNKDLKLALDAGASDYLRKPVDKLELLARTHSHIRMARYIKEIKERDKIINKEREDRIEQILESSQAISQQIEETTSFFIHERRAILEDIEKLRNEGKNDKTILETIIKLLQQNHQMSSSTQLHAQNNEFIKKLLKLHPNLIPSEIELCLYLKNKISSKEIATLTFRAENTIKVLRSRLRKKLGLETERNLFSYLNSI